MSDKKVKMMNERDTLWKMMGLRIVEIAGDHSFTDEDLAESVRLLLIFAYDTGVYHGAVNGSEGGTE